MSHSFIPQTFADRRALPLASGRRATSGGSGSVHCLNISVSMLPRPRRAQGEGTVVRRSRRSRARIWTPRAAGWQWKWQPSRGAPISKWKIRFLCPTPAPAPQDSQRPPLGPLCLLVSRVPSFLLGPPKTRPSPDYLRNNPTVLIVHFFPLPPK